MGRGANTDTATGRGRFSTRAAAPSAPSKQIINYLPNYGADPRDENRGNYGFIERLTTADGRRLPGITVGGQEFYAVPVPVDPKLRAFLKGLVPRLQAGEVHRIDEWCQLLQEAGVGYKKKGSKEGKPLGEATARLRWRELAYQSRLPLISMATGADDLDVDDDESPSQGFGLARNREEVRKSSASLRRRAAKMREVAEAGRQAVAKGTDEAAIRLPGLTEDQQAAFFYALETRPHTNAELAVVLASAAQLTETEGAPLPPEQRRQFEQLSGSRIRLIIHNARLLGYKVCADHSGYWRADSDPEMLAYCDRLEARAELVEKRAAWTDENGAFNFPETKAEAEEIQRIVRSQFVVRDGGQLSQDLRLASPEYLASETAAADARSAQDERDEEAMTFIKGQANAFLERTVHTPEYQLAKKKLDYLDSFAGTGIAPGNDVPRPTRHERELVKAVQDAKSARKIRKPSRLPQARKGSTPRPWQRPAPGEGSRSKGNKQEPRSASAAEILARGEQGKGASAEAIPAVPW